MRGSIVYIRESSKLCFCSTKTLVGPRPERGEMTDAAPKIGRPRKAPDEQRTEWLPRLRATPAEVAFAEDLAVKAGLSLPEFCRRAILGKRIAPRRARAVDAALLELNRAGVNLNQIAARVNMTGDLADDFREVLAELRAAIEKVAADGS